MGFSESMTPVCWGVLGASEFAQAKAVPGMLKAPSAVVKALASRSLHKAQAAAAALVIPDAHGSYEALLLDPAIEAIYIPLPNHLHVPWSLKALAAGKHVLCEKPIALTASELQPLLQAQRQSGLIVAEAFMVRHHPQWQVAQRLVSQGRIGNVRAIHCAFSYTNVDPLNIRNQRDIGGGALYDIGCYAINTARYILGREPLRVVACANVDPVLNVDRLTSAIMDFGDVHATFTVGTQHTAHQRVQIMGSNGRLELLIPFNAPPDHACQINLDPGSDVSGTGTETITIPAVDQYMLQAEAFSQSVRTRAPIANDLEDAYKNALAMDAVIAAMRSGTWVDVRQDERG